MQKTTIAVRCDDDSHGNDAKFASKLITMEGVADVIETFIRLGKGGREYCMLVESYGDKKAVAKLTKMLKSDKGVRYILRTREGQAPL